VKIVVTGASGLLGWHVAVRLHARNCAARFRKQPDPFKVTRLDRAGFCDRETLINSLAEADVVLHFAGANRGTPAEIEHANPDIAELLVRACKDAGVKPHIVYANSIHAGSDTPYGRSKFRAGEILGAFASRLTNLVLPHIFGEGARPHYNNVTATFIDQVVRHATPSLNASGSVQLLHAGVAAEAAIGAAIKSETGTLRPESQPISVPELFARIETLHRSYQANEYPDFSDSFQLALFNTYRVALYPECFPQPLKLNSDTRGTLFEAVKGGGGGQTFLSWTQPGQIRGNHFHLKKVERFLVLEGEATIRIRRVLGGPTWEYHVNGIVPAVVDMPTMHTHNIENTGSRPLLTLFWTHEIFDPGAPDTYADPVIGG
jgi:UDP-2-acetamido-2,6-beta-L-arabino-hexul-4-ose reductase